MIDSLRARGDTLVLLSELAGITRDEAMPTLPPAGATTRLIELATYGIIGGTQQLFFDIFILAAVLGVVRLIVLLGLALVQRFRKHPEYPPYAPSVTVVARSATSTSRTGPPSRSSASFSSTISSARRSARARPAAAVRRSA